MRAGGSYKAPLPFTFLTPATPPPTCSQSQSKSKGGILISINSPSSSSPSLRLSTFLGPRLCSGRRIALAAAARARARAGGAVNGASETASASLELEILSNGKKPYLYLDEMDILTFLDPPNHLIPLDPTSYNPAAYLWKKIGDIPEERRHRLLQLLNPRLISIAWEIAGTRCHDPKLLNKTASNFLSNKDAAIPFQVYNCRTSGVNLFELLSTPWYLVWPNRRPTSTIQPNAWLILKDLIICSSQLGPLPIAWIKFFKKTIFCGNNGKTYGCFIGGSIVAQFANLLSPLYFEVTQIKEVMSTKQPCDLAYEFGDGLLDLHECPGGFPKPVKHSYPFSDEVVIYIRHIGPGVLVGQAWQEGKN